MKRPEPVRILYLVMLAVGAVLGIGGIADYIPDTALFWLGVVLAVLTVVCGEMTRAKVTPLADPRDSTGRALTPDVDGPPVTR